MTREPEHPSETWIGIIRPLPGGERLALAWVRRHDEWLAGVGAAPTADAVGELGRMYLEAVARRGYPPDRLDLDDATHASRLRALIGDGPAIEIGFDQRASDLCDAAVSAVAIAEDAERMLAGDRAAPSHAERMYASMYEAVEQQISEGDPPDVGQTADRLVGQGASRAQAIHAIAVVLMRAMGSAMAADRPFDTAAYVAALRALTADRS